MLIPLIKKKEGGGGRGEHNTGKCADTNAPHASTRTMFQSAVCEGERARSRRLGRGCSTLSSSSSSGGGL